MFGFLAMGVIWDLSSLTRDQTHTPCAGRQSLNHWIRREFPVQMLLSSIHKMSFSFLMWPEETLFLGHKSPVDKSTYCIPQVLRGV